MNRRLFLKSSAAMLFAGCATPQDEQVASLAWPAPPSGNLGRIYFYREIEGLLLALAPQVVINGRAIGRAVPGEAFFRDANPGRYRVLVAGSEEQVITLQVAPGGEVFVKITVALDFLTPRLVPRLVDREAGRAAALNQRLVSASP